MKGHAPKLNNRIKFTKDTLLPPDVPVVWSTFGPVPVLGVLLEYLSQSKSSPSTFLHMHVPLSKSHAPVCEEDTMEEYWHVHTSGMMGKRTTLWKGVHMQEFLSIGGVCSIHWTRAHTPWNEEKKTWISMSVNYETSCGSMSWADLHVFSFVTRKISNSQD